MQRYLFRVLLILMQRGAAKRPLDLSGSGRRYLLTPLFEQVGFDNLVNREIMRL